MSLTEESELYKNTNFSKIIREIGFDCVAFTYFINFTLIMCDSVIAETDIKH